VKTSRLLLFALVAITSPAAQPGTFLFVKERSQLDPASDPDYVEPFSVVHSPAFPARPVARNCLFRSA
jgi:hypothetical protein